MNDSLRTDVFVRFQPESIACACIYLAARTLEIPLPNRPHWFLLFGATEEEIQEICLKILQLYTRKKVDLSVLESKVEKKKLAIEEAKAQAKGLLPDGTPSLENTLGFSPAPKNESPKEGKGNKPSPLPVQAMKNAKRKMDGTKRMNSSSPVNGIQKGREESRSGSRSREQSYSRSPSRSASPKRRKSESYSTSSGSKSHSRSRSRSDSPPRQFNHSTSYKGSKMRSYKKSKDYKYSTHKPRKSHSRSSSRSRSRSRERSDHSGKYKKKSHYYRERHERSRSYERTGHRCDREHPGHSRHRR
ncbi:cyclin-L2 isoform X2 [Emydura macquarii macquarii]